MLPRLFRGSDSQIDVLVHWGQSQLHYVHAVSHAVTSILAAVFAFTATCKGYTVAYACGVQLCSCAAVTTFMSSAKSCPLIPGGHFAHAAVVAVGKHVCARPILAFVLFALSITTCRWSPGP